MKWLAATNAMHRLAATALILTGYLAVPSLGAAQQWSLRSGLAVRSEYTDNYLYTADDRQWGFTASLLPFLTAERHTEASDVAAILALGGNRVWGPSPVSDYWSGRFGVEGTLHEAQSTWTGNVWLVRIPSLQNQITPSGAPLAFVYLNNAGVTGGWMHAFTERWSLGANAGGYLNRYSAIGDDGGFEDNSGYYAGGTARYLHSDATHLQFAVVYSHYSSDLSSSDYWTTMGGIVHRFSPRLTASASVGGYWSSSELKHGAPSLGEFGNNSGWLWGGGINYQLSESTRAYASISENVTPSGTGTISKTDSANASLTHGFSDRITGRVGVGYSRVQFPTLGNSDNKTIAAEIGATYQLAERWMIEGGYRYSRTRYSQDLPESPSNVVFLSVAYNWPGSSFTGWIGTSQESQWFPGAGAGPVPVTEQVPGAPRKPGAYPGAAPQQPSPFDQLPLP